jgi:predicted branched-subunit amino acid permease
MTTETPALSALPFTLAGLRRGIIAALPFIISNGLAGMVMGVAYRTLGLDLLAATLFSLIVYSGTAQAVTLGLLPLSPSIPALMIACVATNARYLVMGAHLRQLFADMPSRMMLPILYTLVDASWLMTAAEAERGRRDAGYLLGCSLPMFIGWVGGTALGFVLPLNPHGALAVGAAFLPTAFVVALLPTQWRGLRSLLPWCVSAAVAAAVVGMVGQSWAMLIGGAVGVLVAAVRGDDV